MTQDIYCTDNNLCSITSNNMSTYIDLFTISNNPGELQINIEFSDIIPTKCSSVSITININISPINTEINREECTNLGTICIFNAGTLVKGSYLVSVLCVDITDTKIIHIIKEEEINISDDIYNLPVTQTTSSFGGGVEIVIEREGIGFDANREGIKGRICHEDADIKYISDNSISINIPLLLSNYTMETYSIHKIHRITEGNIFSSNLDVETGKLAFDNIPGTEFHSLEANCYVGIELPNDVILHSGSIYIPQLPTWSTEICNQTEYIEHRQTLWLETSLDGITYDIQVEIDHLITHQGWNPFHWDIDNMLIKSRYFRVRFEHVCAIGEFELHGEAVLQSELSTQLCDLSLLYTGTGSAHDHDHDTKVFLDAVKYEHSMTPFISLVTPNTIILAENLEIVLEGTNLDNPLSDIYIQLNGINCIPIETTSTQTKCKVAAISGLGSNPLPVEYIVLNKGRAVIENTVSNILQIGHKWSSRATWGLAPLPAAGDTIYIPKGQTLFFDIDNSPILDNIIIEGSLVFLDADSRETGKDINIHSKRILIQRGNLIIGRETQPYINNKLTITLHGKHGDRLLPIFGTKFLGNYEGNLQIHGRAKSPCWTYLSESAYRYQNEIKVVGPLTNWEIGDEVIIAPSAHRSYKSGYEFRVILLITGAEASEVTLTLSIPLKYSHEPQSRDITTTQTLQFPVEIGLISRNIRILGDISSRDTNYGAIIKSYGGRSITQIQHMEMQLGGQLLQFGQYAMSLVHVDCPLCYIQHSVCANCFNRAFAFDNAYRVLLHDNIAADIKGDGFSVDSVLYAGEVGNIFSHNLVIGTKNAPGFLEKGIVEGSGFFIPGPAQYFRDNVVTATRNRAYYFRCPCIYENFLWPILEFENNYVHGVGLGFDTYFLFPREVPIGGPMDLLCRMPYNNDIRYRPARTNLLNNFTLFSNGGHINLASSAPLTLSNSVLIDSVGIGLLIALSDYLELVTVENVTFRCKDYKCGSALATGVWSDNIIKNVTFANYNDVPAIHADSQWLPSFGELYWMRFSQIHWENTTNYVKWEGYDLWTDEDGSFAGIANSTITPYQPHLDMGEPLCDILSEAYGNALRCKEEVQIRPFMIDELMPGELYYYNLTLRREEENSLDDMETFYKEHNFWSNYTYRFKWTPWEYMGTCFKVPVVLGETYWVRWRHDFDFQDMRIFPFHRWNENDQNVILKFRYYDTKDYLDVFTVIQDNLCNHTYERVNELPNKEQLKEPDAQIGDYYHEEDTKLLNIILGKKPQEIDWFVVSAPRNIVVAGDNTDMETTFRYWSEPDNWPNGQIPSANDDVIIKKPWRMVLDTNSTALNSLIILGELHIKSMGSEVILQSRLIEIRGGALVAGSNELPYEGQARIQIISSQGDLSESVRYGSIFTYGRIQLIGKQGKSKRITQLRERIEVGGNILKVDIGLMDWIVGDIVLIEASGFAGEGERNNIKSYNPSNGELVLNNPITNIHLVSTGIYNLGGYHIIIEGKSSEDWGGKIDIEDRIFGELYCIPETYISEVLFSHMGRYHGEAMALRFYYYNLQSDLERKGVIKNSGFIDLYGGALDAFDSTNIEFTNNIIYRPYRLGVHVERVYNLTLSDNVILSVEDEEWEIWWLCKGLTLQGGFFICPFSNQSESGNLVFTNNKVIGSDTIGIASQSPPCINATQIFINNTVQSSTRIGWWLTTNEPKCTSLSQFTMRHNLNYSIFAENNTRALQLSDGIFDTCVESIGYGDGIVNHTFKGSYTRITFIGNHPNGNILNINKRPTLERSIGYEFDNAAIEYFYVDPMCQVNMTDVSGVFTNVTFKDFREMGILGKNVNAALWLSDRFGTMDHKFIYPYIYFSDLIVENTDIDRFILSETWFQHLLVFENAQLPTTWELNNSALHSPNFQLINNTQTIGNYLANCHYQSTWNMYYCNNPDLGILCIDTHLRVTAGIAHLQRPDGYHSSDFSRWELIPDHPMRRVSWLIHTIEITPGLNEYNLTFDGSLPPKMTYFLLGQNDSSKHIKLRAYYQMPLSIHVYKQGERINQMLYSSIESVKAAETLTKCGENIWKVHENILEVFIDGSSECRVRTETVNALWLSLRLKCSVAKFFSDQGPQTFITQISAVLGIAPHRVRVVGIYEGSTKVIAFLDQNVEETDEDKAKLELAELLQILQTKISNGGLDFGAEILEFLVKEAFVGTENQTPEEDANSDSENSKVVLIVGLCLVIFVLLTGVIIFIICRRKKSGGKKVTPVETVCVDSPTKVWALGEKRVSNVGSSVDDSGVLGSGRGKLETEENFVQVLGTEVPKGFKEENAESNILKPIKTQMPSNKKRESSTRSCFDRAQTSLELRSSAESPPLQLPGIVSLEAENVHDRKE